MLTHRVRDRKTGWLPLEWAVRKQTRDTARRSGITDRGELLPGQRADTGARPGAAVRLARMGH